MKTHLQVKPLVLVCLGLVLLTGCAAAETATPEPTLPPSPPTATLEPTSCKDVDGSCIEVWFDAQECSHTGPEFAQPGPVTFIFRNQSSESAVLLLAKLDEDKTWNDVLDYLGPPGSKVSEGPSWATMLDGSYAKPDESIMLHATFDIGTYYWICHINSPPPVSVWAGATLTVED
jgi:hypothetical protein